MRNAYSHRDENKRPPGTQRIRNGVRVGGYGDGRTSNALAAGHTTCDLPDKGDRRPSTPHLEFSQIIIISITIIKSVQPIVAIREIEAGSSLDLNAHVDAVSYSGNRATACCACDSDRNGIGGSARRKPSTQ
ncbi:hypothetical protein FJTKL_11825 [Diaporthe vaccinii]|uniref:Uncharacterized protein n=1 Tax=Diaporthe vaccinii TaxID=105482 RepID=A0ABR4EFW3_9PEZI